ncbi:MAG: M20/M25/M40 family metallo-hydrolase [Bdellovibrionia bacterium]
MTRFILLVLMLGGFNSSFAAAPPAHHYLVPEQNLAYLPVASRPPVVARDRGLALTTMSLQQVDQLVRTLHEKRFTCGGLMDVESLIARNSNPIRFLQAMRNVPVVGKNRPPHRLQASYPNQVNLALSKMSAQRFEETWRALAAFPNRYSRGQQGLAATMWLKDNMLKWAAEAGRTDIGAALVATGGPNDGYPQSSVVIRVPGTDPKLPAILLGGHFDTFNGKMPGADDDASGSATVIEVFRAMLDTKMRFQRDVYFAFYAAEELGLVGSGYVTREFRNRNIPLAGVMQFDMVAFRPTGRNDKIFFISDYTNEPLTAFTRDLAIKYLGMQPGNIGSTACGYACSDHASWHNIGVPTVFPFESDISNYNPTIHTTDDDFTKVDFKHALQFVRLGVAFAVEMAQPAQR